MNVKPTIVSESIEATVDFRRVFAVDSNGQAEEKTMFGEMYLEAFEMGLWHGARFTVRTLREAICAPGDRGIETVLSLLDVIEQGIEKEAEKHGV